VAFYLQLQVFPISIKNFTLAFINPISPTLILIVVVALVSLIVIEPFVVFQLYLHLFYHPSS